MSGTFILIEGGDGAGKDTQIEKLKELLKDRPTVFTREPGGTTLGKTLREMLLHNSHGPVSLPAEIFLFLGDRAQHVEEVVKPALAEGKVVISNRSWVSFLAYQIYGRNLLDWRELVETAIEKIFKNAPADLILILDVDPEVGNTRQKAMGKAPDVMESMAAEARRAIREAFLSIAKTLPTAVVIDANRPVDEVWEDVKAEVLRVI
ncbi:dTMP kinase [Patescibacteria group bacterium]|nr:dTMP kinase [Patescibacteria group bacterium]